MGDLELTAAYSGGAVFSSLVPGEQPGDAAFRTFVTVEDTAPVPEPTSALLVATGAALAWKARRGRRALRNNCS
jgi:hypothetical protein